MKKAKIILIILLVLFIIFFVIILTPIMMVGYIVHAFADWLFGKNDDLANEDPFADRSFIESAYIKPREEFLAQFRPLEKKVLEPYTAPWSLMLAFDRLVHDELYIKNSNNDDISDDDIHELEEMSDPDTQKTKKKNKGKNKSDHEQIVKRLLPRTVFVEKENIVETDVCELVATDEKEGDEIVYEWVRKTEIETTPRRIFLRIDAYDGTYKFKMQKKETTNLIGDSECGDLYQKTVTWYEQLESGPDQPYLPLLRYLAAYGIGNKGDLPLLLEMASTYDPTAYLPPYGLFKGNPTNSGGFNVGKDVVPSEEMMNFVRRYYDPDRLDVLSQLTWPVIGYTSISSPFGPRIHPIKKVSSFHYGIDIPAPHGRPVKAILPGTVTSSGWMGGYGNTVILDHGDGLVSLYAHLSKISVRSGDHVAGNTEIGQIGTTGLSTGNHLHFEIRINGSYTDPVAHYKLKEMNIRAEQGAGGEENY